MTDLDCRTEERIPECFDRQLLVFTSYFFSFISFGDKSEANTVQNLAQALLIHLYTNLFAVLHELIGHEIP